MHGVIQEGGWMEWLATHHKWSHANTEYLITVQWPEQQSLVKTITRFTVSGRQIFLGDLSQTH